MSDFIVQPMLLTDAQPNQTLIIESVEPTVSGLLYLHGFSSGALIKIISKHWGQPLLVEIREVSMAIDSQMAKKIKVSRMQH